MINVWVCKAEDDFIDDKPRWFADLSNGERIWMDDNRPGVDPPQAWIRLGLYLQETQAKIVRLYLQFRSHLEAPLPDNAPAYYFAKGALAFYGNNATISMFAVGYYDGNKLQVQVWRLPELIQEWIEERELNSIKDKSCLIINKGYSDELLEKYKLLPERADR
jgi:hypothetical protein